VVIGFALLGLGIYKLANQGNEDTILESLRDTEIVLDGANSGETPLPEEAPPEPPPIVNADMRLTIEAIDVVAPVITQGVRSDGIPDVPITGYEVTWYNFSASPGTASNAVFSGHVTWDGKHGVFWDLKNLQKGDAIKIETKEGATYVYEVLKNFRVDPDDPKALTVMEATSESTATFITCGGIWLPNPSERFGGNYSERVIVQARLVSPSVSGG
jgi:LPXTG-site transpeptidase (sortase) family protein